MKQTCYLYLRAAFAASPDAPALLAGAAVRSHAALLAEIDALAGFLAGCGVGAGDAVTVFLPTQAEAIAAFYAINRLGAAANLVHPLAAAATLAASLRMPRMKAVFAPAALPPETETLLRKSDLPCIRCGQEIAAFGMPYAACLRAGEGTHAPCAQDPEAPAALLHGGGTTGESKTVLLSSANLNAIAQKLERFDDPHRQAGEAALAALPLFHAFGLAVAVHYPLTHGYCCLPLPRFSPAAAIDLLRRYRPAFLVGVPAMFRKLAEAPGFAGDHLQALRLVFCGGDALPPALKEAFDAAVRAGGGTARLRSGYGLTEVSSVCTVNAEEAARPASVGQPLPGVTVEIRDDAGRTLPPGEVGEIAVSGDTVMLGYFTGDLGARGEGVVLDAAGRRWILTGDLGRLHADGTLDFIGRKKRVILHSGYTVFPAELEAAALALPFVAEACAVEAGEDIRLFVTLNAAHAQPEAAIADACRAQLPRYAWPRSVTVLPALPHTALGKIDYLTLMHGPAARSDTERKQVL